MDLLWGSFFGEGAIFSNMVAFVSGFHVAIFEDILSDLLIWGKISVIFDCSK